jgi:hypothetical protein
VGFIATCPVRAKVAAFVAACLIRAAWLAASLGV